MLRLSINMLSNVMGLLRKIGSSNIVLNETTIYYPAFSVSFDTMIEMATRCGWISSSADQYSLTERGREILAKSPYNLSPENIRIMLEDYLGKIRPVWRSLIPAGRKEATIYMTKDERACFFEAGLLTLQPDVSVVDWWDRMSAIIRGEQDDKKNETGRRGERLTLMYEENRTNSKPVWQSIETNKAGYDIISARSDTDIARIFIEVKSTGLTLDSASFFVSKHEWDIASHSNDYFFYLWSINSNYNQLAILTPKLISNYIPINQQNGEWESVKIPFSEFADYFKVIEMEGVA